MSVICWICFICEKWVCKVHSEGQFIWFFQNKTLTYTHTTSLGSYLLSCTWLFLTQAQTVTISHKNKSVWMFPLFSAVASPHCLHRRKMWGTKIHLHTHNVTISLCWQKCTVVCLLQGTTFRLRPEENSVLWDFREKKDSHTFGFLSAVFDSGPNSWNTRIQKEYSNTVIL